MTETGKLRIMLVDDSTETREYLRKLLQFESQLELAGMASNGKEAVDLALKVKPDLILMDINMPVMDGISAAEIIFREMPRVRVVMMSVQSEMAYLRRAMQVGAREFLVKPFTHEELLNIIGEVGSLTPAPAETLTGGLVSATIDARGRPVKRGTLVTVFSPRGGAGCSTVALNLAIALQGQRKAQVLLIDGNLRFGALDAMLNLQISRSIADVVRALADADAELLQLNTLPHSTGVRLLAAPPSPEMADLVTVQHVEQIVALAQRHFDYIVVDLGSRLDDRALSFMDAAHCIFVLLVPDIPAIKNVRLFLGVASSLEYEAEKISLVLNRANPRGGINAEAIERHLKQPIVASIPDSPRVAQVAINRGVPLMFLEREVDKNIPVTSRLLDLSKLVPEPGVVVAEAVEEAREGRMLEAVPADGPVSQDQKGGIIGRLFKRGS